MMLEFLVTSKARRRLLQLLWSAPAQGGSAADFARRARVGYASAYRELRAMHALGLVVHERRDGADVYRANPSHPLGETFRQLVDPSPPNPGDESSVRAVRRQLKALGAPLQQETGLSEVTVQDEDLEETVVRGVQLAHRDPDVARALPVCLFKQRDRLRPEDLRHHAVRFGEKRSLGFFLELTAKLSNDPRFKAWTRPLRDGRCTAAVDFFHTVPRSRFQRRATDARTPEVARHWGLRMNMDMDTFRSTFDKFADVA